MRFMRTLILLFAAAVTLAARGRAYRRAPAVRRSRAVTAEFQRWHPCPSTGKRYGACPGWIKDHRIPLCKGGPDAAWNLEWQTVAAAKAKDRVECK